MQKHQKSLKSCKKACVSIVKITFQFPSFLYSANCQKRPKVCRWSWNNFWWNSKWPSRRYLTLKILRQVSRPSFFVKLSIFSQSLSNALTYQPSLHSWTVVCMLVVSFLQFSCNLLFSMQHQPTKKAKFFLLSLFNVSSRSQNPIFLINCISL